MNQVLICLKEKNGSIRLDVLDSWRKELVALGKSIRTGDLKSIPNHVRKSLDAGASPKDIQMVAEFILGDKKLLSSILALQKALSYEESNRKDYISIIDDCKE